MLWLAARAAADDNSSNKEQDYASLKLKPRVVSFNVMVAGLSGLGKTTTCNMLFDAWQGNSPSQEKRKIRRATPHVDVSRKIERYDKRTNTILRVRVVDTPGFGNNIDHKHAVRPITKYIRKCRDEQFRAETGARKETEADGDRLVHACVYFISPHRFLEIDRHFLRHVQRELAIVPVIAKTDTLTDEELAEYRAMLRDEFTKNNIQVYDFGEKSSELLEKRAFARGRERGEPLGIIAATATTPGARRSSSSRRSRTSPCSRICYSQNTRSRSSSTRRLGTQNIARDASGWATRRTPPSLLLFWLLSGGLWGCPSRSRRAPVSLLY